MLHNCMRNNECECSQLCSYLIAIAFHRKESDITSFLQGGGFLNEPEIRMPFEPFMEWLQLEIYRGNYEKADELLRQYIFQSTRLKTESESTSKQEYFKGMFGGMRHQRSMMGTGSFGMNITKDLPLSKDEYYQLLELLVVYIWLPSKGYQETIAEINDLPMPQEIR
jgi:hypothetical protein